MQNNLLNTMQNNSIQLQDIFTMQNIIIYVIIINIIGFLAMWIDKKKAKKGAWRISEHALFIITFLGGRNRNYSRNVYF